MTSTLDVGAPSPAGTDRTPPHNLDAEASILGAMLLSRDAIAEVSELVGEDDFYRGAHRTMFEAARTLYDRGEPVDEVTLADELESRSRLADVGGRLAIADIAARVPTAANAVYYARIVAEHALRRRLIDVGGVIARLGFDGEREAENAVDAAEAALYAVSEHQRRGDITAMKELVNNAFELIERLHANDSAITGLETGFKDFDELTAGLQPGNLVIVAARPAVGKSTLVTNMAMHVAAGLRLPVVMFSLEMSQIELVLRILSSEARIASDRIRTGRLQEDDWPRLSQAVGRISEAPMFIDDTPGITLTEIRSKSRRLKQQHGLSLIVVDYLQLMASPRRVESRVQEVSELSRGLKVLAKELDVPVVALSQLSRKPEERAKDDRRPVLSDLRESGCLTAATRLLRADTGTEVTLGDLAASGARDVPVWSLDDRWRLVRSNLTHAFPSGTKPVFRMTLASGRVVEATGNHKFRTLDAWTPLEELKLGDRLAVPRRLPEPSDTVRMDPDELVLLAHLLGDGCVLPRQPVHYTSADPANLEAVEAAARRRFGITPRRVVQDRWGHTYLPSSHHLTHGLRNPITAWWDDLGLHDCRSHQKFIPDDVHRAAADQIALFLRHLWATDGSLLKSQTTGAMRLHYATTSRRLADDVQRLLLRLGIQGRITRSGKGAGTSFNVDIYGVADQTAFMTKVGIHGTRGTLIPKALTVLSSVRPVLKMDTIPPSAASEIQAALVQSGRTIATVLEAPRLRAIAESDTQLHREWDS